MRGITDVLIGLSTFTAVASPASAQVLDQGRLDEISAHATGVYNFVNGVAIPSGSTGARIPDATVISGAGGLLSSPDALQAEPQPFGVRVGFVEPSLDSMLTRKTEAVGVRLFPSGNDLLLPGQVSTNSIRLVPTDGGKWAFEYDLLPF